MDQENRRHQKPGGAVGWIIGHPKTSVSVVVLLFLLITAFVADRAFDKRFASKVSAIRALGEPTCVEDLNSAQQGLSGSTNVFADILKEAAAMEAIQIPDDVEKNLPLPSGGVVQIGGFRWTAEQREAVHKYLDSIKEPLRRIRGLLREGPCEHFVKYASPMISFDFPKIIDVRSCMNALCLEAETNADDDDCSRGVQLLIDNFAFSKWAGTYPTVLACLIEAGGNVVLQASIGDVVNKCTISGDDLAELQRRLAAIENGPDLKRALMLERVFFLDTADSLRRNRLRNPFNAPRKLLSAIPGIVHLDLAEGLDAYTNMVQAIDEPDIHTVSRLQGLNPSSALPAYCINSKVMVPSFTRMVIPWVKCAVQNRALQAALAAERYRLKHGKWPTKLEDVSPAFLQAVPVDPLDEKPIRYTIWSDGIKVWSVGEDLSDDGGDIGWRDYSAPKTKKYSTDWGWMILNPELRGRPAPVASTQQANP